MSSNGLFAKAAIPYAEALFESSQPMQLVEITREDLNLISTTIEKSSNLKSFLDNPLVVISAKKDVLKNLFINQINNHVLNFLFILIERRRINLLNSIVNYYLDLVNQLDFVTLVTVYTAVPLNEKQENSLQEKLQAITDSKVVQLIINVKPDLIGGFVIKIGSKVIDMSIYGQLNQISSYLNSACL